MGNIAKLQIRSLTPDKNLALTITSKTISLGKSGSILLFFIKLVNVLNSTTKCIKNLIIHSINLNTKVFNFIYHD